MDHLNLANRISQNYHLLSKKEKLIANYVLEKQNKIYSISIKDLSANVKTSNATITRFCHKLNYRSFAEFKSLIHQEQAQPTDTLTSKISVYYNQLLDSSAQLLESSIVDKLIQVIKKANKILICGLGSSGLTAMEFKYQLMRMGFIVDAETDPHMMLMNATLLTENDLFIGISNSGETKEIIDAAKLAKIKNAHVFSITTKNHTELTKFSDGVIFTSGMNSISDERFINSQLPIYFILDIVCYTLLEEEIYYQNRNKTLLSLSHD